MAGLQLPTIPDALWSAVGVRSGERVPGQWLCELEVEWGFAGGKLVSIYGVGAGYGSRTQIRAGR